MLARMNRTCNECHTNPSSYAQFTCTTCHGRTEMDSRHRNRSGYAYDSNRCYACHPTGRGDQRSHHRLIGDWSPTEVSA